MEDLKKQAEDLGIDVDGRWSDQRLREEIARAQDSAATNHAKADDAPKSKAKARTFRINRDFWDENGDRHRKGTIVEMTADEAMDGLESGAISSVK